MVRQLKYHEKKLLKKVDFLAWKREHNLRELQVGGIIFLKHTNKQSQVYMTDLCPSSPEDLCPPSPGL